MFPFSHHATIFIKILIDNNIVIIRKAQVNT
jgi:hypothetical protein